MWIKFIRDIGTAKNGSFADVDAAIAANYVNLGVAEAAPEDPVQRTAAIVLSQLQPLIEAQGARARGQVAPPRDGLAKPRTVSGAVDSRGIPFNHISGGTSEVERRRGPNAFIRSIVVSLGCPDHEQRDAAHADLCRPWDEGGYGCQRTMTEGTGSSLGYTTPVVYESMIAEFAAEQQVIVPFADRRPLAARQVEWPALNQYGIPNAGQSAMFGGIQVYRKGETLHRTGSDLTTKKIQLLAQDLTAYTTLSRDVVFDSPGVDGYAVKAIGGALGWREDWESINGNGVGQFLGYLNAPCTLFVARNTSSHIKYQDVFIMKTRMMSQASKKCWITHPYALNDIWTLQDPSGKFVFVPNSYASQGPGPGVSAGGGMAYELAGFLLGDPIYASEKVPALGTAGDLSYVSRASYWVGERTGIEIGLSEHFLFDQDELAIRAKVRNDGKPGMVAPLYLADGSQSNQVSGFVVLQ